MQNSLSMMVMIVKLLYYSTHIRFICESRRVDFEKVALLKTKEERGEKVICVFENGEGMLSENG